MGEKNADTVDKCYMLELLSIKIIQRMGFHSLEQFLSAKT